jgi:hypothetical protein
VEQQLLLQEQHEQERGQPGVGMSKHSAQGPPVPESSPPQLDGQGRGVEQEEHEQEEDEEGEDCFTQLVGREPHPLGVKPLGNFFLAPAQERAPEDVHPQARVARGLGAWQALLADEPFLLTLLATLDHASLARLARCSKAMYCYANAQEVWRALVLRDFGQAFGSWDSPSWKRAYLAWAGVQPLPPLGEPSVRVEGIYSDHLYAAWRGTIAPLPELCGVGIPGRDNLPKRAGLSKAEFVQEYEGPNCPVILQGLMEGWPAMRTWSMDHLVRVVGPDHRFRAEAVDLHLPAYRSYAAVCQEESPLYLFDKHFAQGPDSPLGADYAVPDHFAEDLFALLGAARPDFQWLIIGPPRSGSTFHIDPNSTNAFNAVVRGRKKWILFPPDQPPPGIFPSADGGEVTSPVSLCEWFLHHYPQLQRLREAAAAAGRAPPFYEGVCEPGEILFVPCGRGGGGLLRLDAQCALTRMRACPHACQCPLTH